MILAYALADSWGVAGVALATGIGWSAIITYQTVLYRVKRPLP